MSIKQTATQHAPVEPQWRIGSVVCLALVALTWVVFAQTVSHPFVNYDDDTYVYDNAQISGGVNLTAVRWSLTHSHSDNWHPLTSLSHMVDCAVYGLRPYGHHLTNLLLHTTTVCLLFVLLWRMTRRLWPSAFVAAAFAVHPLHVESVAWISERKDVLSGMFFVLTLLAYVWYVHRPSFFRYLAVAAAFSAGLLSKSMLATAPIVMLLLDYWPLGRLGSPAVQAAPNARWTSPIPLLRLAAEKIPFLLLSAAVAVATVFAQHQTLKMGEHLTLLTRLNNAAISWVLYVWQTVWPRDLAVFYPHPGNSTPAPLIAGAWLLFLVLTAAALISIRRRPYIFVGWLWYVIMLVPVIGIVQVGLQGHADRYMYLPQIGLLLLVSWTVVELPSRGQVDRLVAPLAIASLVALTWSARIQTSYWRNSEALWRHTLAVTSGNFIADYNLANILAQSGRAEEAAGHYARAITARPQDARAHSNFAVALFQLGRKEEAMQQWRESVSIDPTSIEARNNLAVALVDDGKAAEAIQLWERNLALRPEDVDTAITLAWVLATHPDDAIRNGSRAHALAGSADELTSGRNFFVRRVLAVALAESGNFQAAIGTAESALNEARASGNSRLVQALEGDLASYRSGSAIRSKSVAIGF